MRKKETGGKKKEREGETESFMLLWFCSSLGNKIGLANF